MEEKDSESAGHGLTALVSAGSAEPAKLMARFSYQGGKGQRTSAYAGWARASTTFCTGGNQPPSPPPNMTR